MKVAVIYGDGIGPEVMRATLDVLGGVDFYPEYIPLDVGYDRWRREGVAVTQEDLDAIKACDVLLKAPVTTPPRMNDSFESVTLQIRRVLDVYANIRPFKSLSISPFKGVDMVIVRENTEDVYSGKESYENGVAVTERVITEAGSRRIAEYAFKLARQQKRRKVVCIHKANIMKKTCGLFREVFYKVAEGYPDIAHGEMLVDACAFEMIKNPQSFDVLATTNMFGDILSDEAAQLIGGLGMAPGANIGDNFALFEPIHGSAPNRAGKHTANPISMILAAKMMLDWLGEKYNDTKCTKAGAAIENGMIYALHNGQTVPDCGGNTTTVGMAEAIAAALTAKTG